MKPYKILENGPWVDLESIQEIWPVVSMRTVCFMWKNAFQNENSEYHGSKIYTQTINEFRQETYQEHLERITKDVYEPFVEAWKNQEKK